MHRLHHRLSGAPAARSGVTGLHERVLGCEQRIPADSRGDGAESSQGAGGDDLRR